jgi:hypothetical protein
MKMIISILMTFSTIALGGYDYVIDKYSESITIKGNESLLMTGGGMYQLDAEDFSTIEIQNTAPFELDKGGVGTLNLTDSSHLNVTMGEIYRLRIAGNATAVLLGGWFDGFDSWQAVSVIGRDPITHEFIYNRHIEMIVKDYTYNALTKILKGTWGDDSLFSIQLIDHTQDHYSPAIDNIKFTIIPEPISLMLLALGGLLIRRR